MSAIFGIYRQDQEPIDRAALECMGAALPAAGINASLGYLGQAGIGCRRFGVSPEDAFDTQPLRYADCLLAAHVLLDNRADLCRHLAIVDRPTLPDSALLMAAYREYGLGCVEHFQGDWVFALWDDRERRLILARCATGNAGLFWYRRNRLLLFATGITGLLAHPDCAPALNIERITALLNGTLDEHRDGTVYDGVRLLEPGHLLIATQDAVKIHRWWRPEDLTPLRLPSTEQYYEAFRQLYETAVTQFLRGGEGRIAAALSGGLDSASVVSLAAPRVTRPLLAFVHTPLYEPVVSAHRIADELPQAVQLARHVGNVSVVPLRSAHISVMEGIARGLEREGAPTHAACHHYWLTDVLQSAQAAGVRVLLTGQGGNATVSYTGNGNLWPQVRSGRMNTVLRSLRTDESGTWSAVKHRLIKPLLRRRRPLSMERPFDLTAEFRLGLLNAGRSRVSWMAAGAMHGLSVRDPTFDRRIVEFCWRIPDDIQWAGGRQRGLIRVGMASYLPQEVRDEKRKGMQSSDILARMRKESAEIAAAIERIAENRCAAELLDLAGLRRDFGRLMAGGMSMHKTHNAQRLVRSLSVGWFLLANA